MEQLLLRVLLRLIGDTQVLPRAFLESLGTCRLAGALDVQHSPTGKRRCLGAFLYAGGFLLLVKPQRNRVYEPKHWFALSGATITDDPEDGERQICCGLGAETNIEIRRMCDAY